MMIKSSTDNLKYYQTYIIDVISLNIYAVFKVLTHVAKSISSYIFRYINCLKCFNRDKSLMVEMRRVELLTPCLQGKCSPN